MKLIGLVGKLQSGKTTTANIIKELYPKTIKFSFGDLLKEMILKAGLCNEKELWGEKTAFSRLMLQKIGTEIIRKQVSESFWVDHMRTKLVNLPISERGNRYIVIDDIRFLNEASLIKELSGNLIRIVRPSLEQNNEENLHLSETEQDSIKVDFEIVNDGSKEDVKNKINDILKLIKL